MKQNINMYEQNQLLDVRLCMNINLEYKSWNPTT